MEEENKVKSERKTKKIIKAKENDDRPKRVLKPKTNNEIKEVKKSLEFSLLEVIIIILVTTLLVSIGSGLIVFKNYEKIKSEVKTDNESLNEIIENYNYIINNYVNEVDKSKLIDAAIQGMYNYLEDEYSIYLDKEDTSSFTEQLNGKYQGVGIEITMNSDLQIVINRVFSDSPAYEAGLQKGDILTELDGVSLENRTSSYVADSIKKSDKQSFVIKYIRDGKEYSATIIKREVIIESVESTEYDSVGYLKIDTFSSLTAEQVKEKILGFSDSVKSIVIDLRDNTGGYLSAAYDISDYFLEKNEIVYQLQYRNGETSSYPANEDVLRKFNKIVVIINEGSASASEVVTLALKESAGAIVVGKTSYGKGTVQETRILNSGAMVKYTSSYWLSPNGNTINKIGIKPNFEVDGVEEQLKMALDLAK